MQTTGADGRVDFDTSFPGRYSDPTIHIHFTLRIGDDERVSSDEIIGSQPLYSDRGNRDTTTEDDERVSDGTAECSFELKLLPDGARLALVTRSSPTSALGSAEGKGMTATHRTVPPRVRRSASMGT